MGQPPSQTRSTAGASTGVAPSRPLVASVLPEASDSTGATGAAEAVRTAAATRAITILPSAEAFPAEPARFDLDLLGRPEFTHVRQ